MNQRIHTSIYNNSPIHTVEANAESNNMKTLLMSALTNDSHACHGIYFKTFWLELCKASFFYIADYKHTKCDSRWVDGANNSLGLQNCFDV